MFVIAAVGSPIALPEQARNKAIAISCAPEDVTGPGVTEKATGAGGSPKGRHDNPVIGLGKGTGLEPHAAAASATHKGNQRLKSDLSFTGAGLVSGRRSTTAAEYIVNKRKPSFGVSRLRAWTRGTSTNAGAAWSTLSLLQFDLLRQSDAAIKDAATRQDV